MCNHYISVVVFYFIFIICQCNNSIDILENIPKEKLLDEQWLKKLIENRKPVIIRQSINSHWDAITKWKKEYLIETVPELHNVILHNGSRFLFQNKHGSPLAEYAIAPYKRQLFSNMSTETFFEIGLTKSNKMYPSYSNENNILYSDLNDYENLTSLFQKVTNNKDHNTYVWLSFENFTTQFHYDVDPNIYCQMYGTKNWKIIHPKYWNQMYVYPSLHPSHRQSQINFSASHDKYMDFYDNNIDIIEFELHSGDILFLPSYYFHEVKTVSNWSASINFWVNGYELNYYLYNIAQDAMPYVYQYQLSQTDVIPYLSKLIINNGQDLICNIVYNSYKPMIENKHIQLMTSEKNVILFVPQSIHETNQICDSEKENKNEYYSNVNKCPFDFGPSKRFKH
eukprot:24521_1